MTRTPGRGPVTIFAVVCVAAVAFVAWSLMRARQEASSPAATRPGPSDAAASVTLPAPPAPPFVLVRQLASGSGWSRLALAPLDAPDGPRFITPLTCVRAYVAGGRGLCLASNGADGRAIVFDATTFVPEHTLVLTGPPSRARVSRDGRLGAVTVFESGHSYAEEGFSTRTTVLDLETGTPFPELESFAIWQDEARLRRIDINLWGVTFIPGTRRFYATLAYGGTPYLAEGDLDRREVRVLAPHVECRHPPRVQARGWPALAPLGAPGRVGRGTHHRRRDAQHRRPGRVARRHTRALPVPVGRGQQPVRRAYGRRHPGASLHARGVVARRRPLARERPRSHLRPAPQQVVIHARQLHGRPARRLEAVEVSDGGIEVEEQ